jgi:tRNA (guanine26-N2/guanine27-N2)-dimethyltransferase
VSKDGISVLEAMSATGLRAIRYAKEVKGVGTVIANDMDKAAVERIKLNVEFNGVADTVKARLDDARVVMIQHPQVCCLSLSYPLAAVPCCTG